MYEAVSRLHCIWGLGDFVFFVGSANLRHLKMYFFNNTMYNVYVAVKTQLNLLYYTYNVYTTTCFGLF